MTIKIKSTSTFMSLLFTAIILFLFTSCKENNKNKRVVDGVQSFESYDSFKTIHPEFKLQSEAVVDGKLLDHYKCEEKNNGVENSIPLSWSNVPEGTNSLAIIMYHYPKKDNKTEVNSYLHLWGISPSVSEISYKMANSPEWFMGSNKDGTAVSYTSPCSRGKGEHTYTIALFALKETPKSLPKSNAVDVDYTTFMEAISETSVIDRTSLTFIDSNQ